MGQPVAFDPQFGIYSRRIFAFRRNAGSSQPHTDAWLVQLPQKKACIFFDGLEHVSLLAGSDTLYGLRSELKATECLYQAFN
jgi:hypothetical protein